MQDTIFALSSGSLPSSVAIIRLSGSRVQEVVETMVGELPPPRYAVYQTFKSLEGDIIDKGIVLFFSSPNSFTGENIAEFHIHGGKAVVSKFLLELSRYPFLRHAEPGEFTKRAFLNRKLNLTEVEALSDLIFAETELQRRVALKNFEGEQTNLYLNWRERILHIYAFIQAELDFSDQEDVSFCDDEKIWDDMKSLINEISEYTNQFRRNQIIRDGYEVLLIGEPNSGKSSLLNYLSGKDLAIVSHIPGTTRDFIETSLDLNGIKVRIIDTAGLRISTEYIETLGIERTKNRAKKADLVLELRDISVQNSSTLDIQSDIIVGTKIDLYKEGSMQYDYMISSVSGVGIEILLKEIEKRAYACVGEINEILPSQLRHIEHLLYGKKCIENAVYEKEIELKAEFLRNASDALIRIVGKIDVEDVLDSIFSKFCIGK